MRGTAVIQIERSPLAVFSAVTDVTRMGEWSPECVAARWLPPAIGPAAGATFEGDNVAKLGPLTIKKWTTVCEVTDCVQGELFQFMAEDFTEWRFELIDMGGDSTRVTQSYRHDAYTGARHFLYETLFSRSVTMVADMTKTLERMKIILESEG